MIGSLLNECQDYDLLWCDGLHFDSWVPIFCGISSLYPVDRGSSAFWNVCACLPEYSASHTGRLFVMCRYNCKSGCAQPSFSSILIKWHTSSYLPSHTPCQGSCSCKTVNGVLGIRVLYKPEYKFFTGGGGGGCWGVLMMGNIHTEK